MVIRTLMCVAPALLLAACSGIQFSNRDDGHSHPYRVASPALKVVTDADCKMAAEVISVPGRFNYLSFKTGLGKIDDSVEFEPGGTIKKVAAKQEGVADDLVKIVTAATGVLKPGLTTKAISGGCQPSVQIYPIGLDAQNNPTVDQAHPLLNVTAR